MTRPSRKTFTVREANAMLPLVRAIVSDLTQLSKEVAERRERLSLLLGGREFVPRDPYHEELIQIEEELQKDRHQLEEYFRELRELGVEPKTEGSVDFPCVLDGREVCLCWQLGEPEVGHWHERGAGFSVRRALRADSRTSERASPSDR